MLSRPMVTGRVTTLRADETSRSISLGNVTPTDIVVPPIEPRYKELQPDLNPNRLETGANLTREQSPHGSANSRS